MKVSYLTDNENQTDFNFIINFSYRDIPIGMAAAGALVYNGPPAVVLAPSLPPQPLMPQMLEGDTLRLLQMRVVSPFANTHDATFNSTTISFGDTASATRYLSAVQVNANGTPVLNSPATAIAQFIYTAPTYLQLTINSMAAMSLSNLNQGEATIWVQLFRAGAKVKNLAIGKPAWV
jgi:hypothetical protein